MRYRFLNLVVCVFLGLLSGCPDTPEAADAGLDASGTDTSVDTIGAGDAGVDAPIVDSGSDAPLVDAGPDVSNPDAGIDGGPTLPKSWDGTVPDEGICTPDGFCVITPLPSAMPLHDLYAASESDVWVIGAYGTLVHWDGTSWRGVTATGGTIVDIHGCGADDVWAVAADREGDILGHDDYSGLGNRLLHWTGSSWSETVPPGEVRAVYCNAADDVWAVGDGAFHFDGTTWTAAAETAFTLRLGRVTSDGTSMWATGSADGENVTLYFDGTTARAIFGSPPMADLVHAYGSTWGAGSDGIYEWDGSDWASSNASPTASLGVTPGAMWAEHDTSFGPWSPSFDPSTRMWSRGSLGITCNDVQARVRGVGDEFWSLSPVSPADPMGYDCALASRRGGGEHDTLYQESVLGELIGPDHFLRVVGSDVVLTQVGEAPVTIALPDADGGPAFRYAGITSDQVVWAAQNGGATARHEDGAWVRHVAPETLWTIEGTETEAWGISLTSLYRWTAADGWLEARSGEFELFRFGPDFWISGEDGLEWWDGTNWVARPSVVDGADVTLSLMGYHSPGQVWAHSTGEYLVVRWNGTEWEGVVPASATWEGGSFGALNPRAVIDAEGDEIWTGGARWIDGEWVRFRSGLAHEIQRVEVGFGQVWLYDFPSYVLRRDAE